MKIETGLSKSEVSRICIGVIRSEVHPALHDLSPGRPAQKAEFGCVEIAIEVGGGIRRNAVTHAMRAVAFY
jgi:hypothetical protein